MAKKIKVVFIVPSLRSGGAERVMSFLAQNLDNETFNVHLVITGTNKDQKYQIEGIPYTFLNKNRVKAAVPAIVKFLLKNRPRIVISAIGHLNMVMGLISPLFPFIKFVSRATTIPGFSLNGEVLANKKPAFLHRLSIGLVNHIVAQSEDMKMAFKNDYGVPLTKMTVINNPVTSKFQLKDRPFAEDGTVQFITVGRLTERKGYGRILEVLAKLETPFHYTIIGSGDFKETIQHTIEQLELTDKVTLVGYTKEINAYLAKSDLYLQGSYVEGFPNALLESCATGTPAVVYDAPGGINEIILEGENGFVAKDQDDFLAKLKVAVSHEWNSGAIRETVYSRYSEEKILENYKQFFLQLT